MRVTRAFFLVSRNQGTKTYRGKNCPMWNPLKAADLTPTRLEKYFTSAVVYSGKITLLKSPFYFFATK
jgi:hypothetical protein